MSYADVECGQEEKFVYTPTKGEFRYRNAQWNEYTTKELLKKGERFQYRPEDILVCTYPRSGTTLTQEIVWHIKNKEIIEKGAKYADIDERFPFLEFNTRFDGNTDAGWFPDILDAQTGGRLIKTHLPYFMIGENIKSAKPKIILVMRNPKDTCVSIYNFYKGFELFGPWSGEWPEFIEMFLRGYTKSGDWFHVTKQWWNERDDLNAHVVFFENLIESPSQEIQRLAAFLDTELTSNQLETILHNCKFDNMAANENVNYTFSTGARFLRKGKVGDWRNWFTVAQNEHFDEVMSRKFNGDVPQFRYYLEE